MCLVRDGGRYPRPRFGNRNGEGGSPRRLGNDTRREEEMARKDALLRLHARLVARRDASAEGPQRRPRLATANITRRSTSAITSMPRSIRPTTRSARSSPRSRAGSWGRSSMPCSGSSPGVYGRCEYCGGKIAEARLNALPYTNSCIDCQRENERTGQALRARSPTTYRWAKIYDKPSDRRRRHATSTSATSRWT